MLLTDFVCPIELEDVWQAAGAWPVPPAPPPAFEPAAPPLGPPAPEPLPPLAGEPGLPAFPCPALPPGPAPALAAQEKPCPDRSGKGMLLKTERQAPPVAAPPLGEKSPDDPVPRMPRAEAIGAPEGVP